MFRTACGVCNVASTRARHGAVIEYLWHLILDLDCIRVGRPTVHGSVDAARLDRWSAVAEELRTCWGQPFLQGGHQEELDYGDSLVASVRADLAADRPPVATGGVPAFVAVRARLDRCRDDTLKH